MQKEQYILTSDTHTAILSSEGAYTYFLFGGQRIRFRTPESLERYAVVKQWDNGYLVVSAIYKGTGEEEEYIDLIPILQNLYIDCDSFLKPIKQVEIKYSQAVWVRKS